MPSVARRRILLTGLAALPLAAAGPVPHPSGPGLVIGAALPLTGALALIGDEALRGISLAAAVQNVAGGIGGVPVRLEVGDIVDQAQAAAAVNRLISKTRAGVILGAGSSDFCYPASAAAELAQTPYIELTAPAEGITRRGFRYLVRTGPTTGMIATLCLATLAQRFAGRRLGLLFNTGATGGAIAAGVLAQKAGAAAVLSIGYPAEGADLFDAIGRLKRAGVEVLVHAAGPEDVLAGWSAMAEVGWWPAGVIGCGDGYLLRETAAAVGPAFARALIVGAPGAPAGAAPMRAAYMATYGMAPRGPESLAAYAGALLLFQALAGSGGATGGLPAALRARTLAAGALANGWGADIDAAGQNRASFVTLQSWHGDSLQPA